MNFSIVTPSYNCLSCLPRCVGSVRNQAYPDVEHIVMDGASSDGTVDWLAQQQADESVAGGLGGGNKLSWLSEPDSGMYDAIQKGWARSHGDVVAWLNCDEQYLPGILEDVAARFARFPEVDVIYGNAIIIDAYGKAIAARREVPLRHGYICNSFLNIYTCTMFFRRRLLDRGMLRFDDRFRYAGDMDLVLRLLEAGVKHQATRRYHALFTSSGNNLSLHERMGRETELIRCEHGGFRSAGVRRMVQGIRQMERFLRGHYFLQTVTYDYVENANGGLSHHQGVRLSGRFDMTWGYPK